MWLNATIIGNIFKFRRCRAINCARIASYERDNKDGVVQLLFIA